MSYKGHKCDFEYALCQNDKQPAKEFIDGLNRSQKAKFEALLRQLAEKGTIWNTDQFKKLQGGSGIWEFIAGKDRLFCFQSGRSWILTNGFRKKTRKTPQKHIDLAIRIMNEHLES